MSHDVDMEDMSTAPVNGTATPKHLIVAIDFGTTFSSVAYAVFEDSAMRNRFNLEQIEMIENYPDEPPRGFLWRSRQEAPTEIWYPKKASRKKIAEEEFSDSDSDPGLTNEGQSEDDSGSRSPSADSSSGNLEHNPIGKEMKDLRPDAYYWGYQVQKQLQYEDTHGDNTRRLARFKLMLDDKGEHTADVRRQLTRTFRSLRKMNLIEQPVDAISDYLKRLFIHTKQQLDEIYDFSGGCEVEFVLCVPVIWTAKACRTMQSAMTTAIKASGLGSLENGSVNNLFIVSEPEAAASCVLAERNSRIEPDETFVLLDAGGGTVDAITYTVDKSSPLRLRTEAVAPGGALCGSSYLNERFEDLLIDKLKAEDYLERNNRTISSIIDGLVADFENGEKRTFDATNKDKVMEPIKVPDLQPNKKKRFKLNRLYFTRKEGEAVFLPSLKGVARVMEDQLRMAKENDLVVEKVILIGGFAGSPSLIKHLRKALAKRADIDGRVIELVLLNIPSTAVARGAVLRALRKDDGPSRTIQSSYGFLVTEHFEPDVVTAHIGVRCRVDKIDGQKYVTNTIDWLIKKGELVDKDKEVGLVICHTFGLHRKRFLCEEILYVSDNRHESHYRRSHPKNAGFEVAGRIVVDMTFLKTDGHITPSLPENEHGVSHYKVEFKLVMIVNGRNLRFEARWPVVDGQVQEVGQTCIAAGFVPGTE